ncbi:3975_t:CDS:2 [Entrophospora sp. SA101]|nr:7988_t:CDS:2 [Entrophospora sp. SA101]CAJ0626442.1 3975_t:CDS:2 [Entrophospora sp. SA101]CAJ0838062.1 13881_t:CDS:2 [Entrophospora sp. SA101]CAJ0845306.1 566_t:CDS:2 [Entrophospora sp. SA101]CAJ0862985.1 20370_t:CDS:2 [Entrophospora sp. SA101]
MQHIEQFKRLLVNEIHERTSLYYTKPRNKFPCTDSEFVAVFGEQLNRFSPAKRTYRSAENEISKNNSNQSLDNSTTKDDLEWFQKNINDAKGHETSNGQLRIIFHLDQNYYMSKKILTM